MIDKNLYHPNRFLYAILGAVLFIGTANLAKYTYIRYFDRTDYIQYIDKVSFDKSEYRPCDIQEVTSHLFIQISSPIRVHSRLYLMKKEGGELQVVKEFNIDSFLVANKEVQHHVVRNPIPCDMEPGTYFYRGILSYKISGVEKITNFESNRFRVIE